jgi:hypothetical protein
LRSSELSATERLTTNDRAYSGSRKVAALTRDQAIAVAEEWIGPAVEVESGKLYETKKEGSRKTEDDVPFRPRSQQRITALMQWLRDGGSDVDNVEIMPEGGLRTLVTLYPGQFVIKVPPKRMLASSTAKLLMRKSESLGCVADKLIDSFGVNTHFPIAIALLLQLGPRKSESVETEQSFKIFTKILPMPALPVPFQFTETQLAYLEGSLASEHAQNTRKGLDKKWSNICSLIHSSAREREKALREKEGGDEGLLAQVGAWASNGFNANGALSEKHPKLKDYLEAMEAPSKCAQAQQFCDDFDSDDWLWAYSAAQSRVFQLPLMDDMTTEKAILAATGIAASSTDGESGAGSQGRSGGAAISGQTEAGLVPLIDMANHSPDPNCEYQWRAERGMFIMTALQDIKAGDPLYVNYGFSDNLHAMLNYGFVLTDPYFDKLALTATRAAIRGGTEVQTGMTIVESDEGANTLMTLLLSAALDTQTDMSFDFAVLSCQITGMQLWADLQRTGVDCLQSEYGCRRSGFGIVCPRNCLLDLHRTPSRLIGTGEYTMESAVCLAAVHHNYLDGGEFVFTPMRKNTAEFIGSIGGGGLKSSSIRSSTGSPGFTVTAPFTLIPRKSEEMRYSAASLAELKLEAKNGTKPSMGVLLRASRRMHGDGGRFACSVFPAGWWTFRWCHENEVRQYHKDTKTGMITDDISLGRWDKSLRNNATESQIAARARGVSEPSSAEPEQPTISLPMVGLSREKRNQNKEENGEEEEKGYFSQFFNGGQACGETGHGRAVEVRFACCNASKPGELQVAHTSNMDIGKVDEPRPCFYVLTVCAPLLCSTSAPVEISHYPACGDCEKRFHRLDMTRTERDLQCANEDDITRDGRGVKLCTPGDYADQEQRRKDEADAKGAQKAKDVEAEIGAQTKQAGQARMQEIANSKDKLEDLDPEPVCSFRVLSGTWVEGGVTKGAMGNTIGSDISAHPLGLAGVQSSGLADVWDGLMKQCEELCCKQDKCAHYSLHIDGVCYLRAGSFANAITQQVEGVSSGVLQSTTSSRLEQIFARAIEREITTTDAVSKMRRHMLERRYGVQHYSKMWNERIEAHDAKNEAEGGANEVEGNDGSGEGGGEDVPTKQMVNATICKLRPRLGVDNQEDKLQYTFMPLSVCDESKGYVHLENSAECEAAAVQLGLVFEGHATVEADNSGSSPHGCYYNEEGHNFLGEHYKSMTTHLMNLDVDVMWEVAGYSTQLKFNIEGKGKYEFKKAKEGGLDSQDVSQKLGSMANGTNGTNITNKTWPPNKPSGVLVAGSERSMAMSMNVYTNGSLDKFIVVMSERLEGYQTTFEEDEQALKAGITGFVKRHSTMLVRNEKRLLKAILGALHTCKRVINPNDSLEGLFPLGRYGPFVRLNLTLNDNYREMTRNHPFRRIYHDCMNVRARKLGYSVYDTRGFTTVSFPFRFVPSARKRGSLGSIPRRSCHKKNETKAPRRKLDWTTVPMHSLFGWNQFMPMTTVVDSGESVANLPASFMPIHEDNHTYEFGKEEKECKEITAAEKKRKREHEIKRAEKQIHKLRMERQEAEAQIASQMGTQSADMGEKSAVVAAPKKRERGATECAFVLHDDAFIEFQEGFDIKKGFKALSIEDCQDECCAEPECTSYSMRLEWNGMPDMTCWLRSSDPDTVHVQPWDPNEGMHSGVVQKLAAARQDEDDYWDGEDDSMARRRLSRSGSRSGSGSGSLAGVPTEEERLLLQEEGVMERCYEAYTADHPTCSGYELCGFTCSTDGTYCAVMGCACDCDKCAKLAQAGTVVDIHTGRCVKKRAEASSNPLMQAALDAAESSEAADAAEAQTYGRRRAEAAAAAAEAEAEAAAAESPEAVILRLAINTEMGEWSPRIDAHGTEWYVHSITGEVVTPEEAKEAKAREAKWIAQEVRARITDASEMDAAANPTPSRARSPLLVDEMSSRRAAWYKMQRKGIYGRNGNGRQCTCAVELTYQSSSAQSNGQTSITNLWFDGDPDSASQGGWSDHDDLASYLNKHPSKISIEGSCRVRLFSDRVRLGVAVPTTVVLYPGEYLGKFLEALYHGLSFSVLRAECNEAEGNLPPPKIMHANNEEGEDNDEGWDELAREEWEEDGADEAGEGDGEFKDKDNSLGLAEAIRKADRTPGLALALKIAEMGLGQPEFQERGQMIYNTEEKIAAASASIDEARSRTRSSSERSPTLAGDLALLWSLVDDGWLFVSTTPWSQQQALVMTTVYRIDDFIESLVPGTDNYNPNVFKELLAHVPLLAWSELPPLASLMEEGHKGALKEKATHLVQAYLRHAHDRIEVCDWMLILFCLLGVIASYIIGDLVLALFFARTKRGTTLTITKTMLVRFYEKHDPASIARVDQIIAAYPAAKLDAALRAKYGESPTEKITITKAMLVRFYENHDPASIARVDQIIAAYPAAKLDAALRAKYGESPAEVQEVSSKALFAAD